MREAGKAYNTTVATMITPCGRTPATAFAATLNRIILEQGLSAI
jgi:hypothetical protein